MSEIDRYAVVGNPVEHSISPRIHHCFAQQTNQTIDYQKIKAPLDGFADTVGTFFAHGGKGLNITLPFKEQAYQFAGCHSHNAIQAQAVNTFLLTDDGVVEGHNTDGIGLVKDLRNNCQINVKDQHILIIGAGGATRGIIAPLFNSGVGKITLANRTLARAQSLRDDFSQYENFSVCSLVELSEQDNTSIDSFAGIINATSASLSGLALPLPASLTAHWAYDLAYANQPTPFMLWCRDKGIEKVFDGLGLLVEQAAESFFLWRKVRPDSLAVLTELTNERAGE